MDNLLYVDFADSSDYENVMKHTYTIKVLPTVSKTPACVQFPNHPKDDHQRLTTQKYWTIASLNKEVNRRFKECTPSHRVVVDNVSFSNVDGNIYLVWADIRKESVFGVELETVHDTPVLLVMDGYGSYKHIYLFHDEKVKKVEPCVCKRDIRNKYCKSHDYIVHLPLDTEVFCVESKKRKEHVAKIQVLRAQESQDIIDNEVHSTMLIEVSSSDDDDDDSSHNNNLL